MNIVLSSGHGKYVRGASCDEPWGLDEVDEARRVVGEVGTLLKSAGVGVTVLNDDQSHNQSDNLNWIVDHHNALTRDIDCSVHFNCYETTGAAMGVEVLYVTQEALAKKVSDAIAKASGLKNRGAKKRTDLKFLNATEEPSVLIEVAFVDSQCDADIYRNMFAPICRAIAESLAGITLDATDPVPPTTTTPPSDVAIPIVTVTIAVDPPDSVRVVIK